MKTTHYETETSTDFEGKKLPAPIAFGYDVDEYENFPELVAAKDELSNDEQVKSRNAKRKNSARAAALTVALKAAGYVQPTLENSVILQLNGIVKSAMASGKHTEASARAAALTLLGLDAWPE